MSQAAPTQAGPDARRQTPQDAPIAPEAPPDGVPDEGASPGNPHALVRESIKYRRRAQEAERRVEALEAEVRALREERGSDEAGLADDLGAARAEARELRTELDAFRRTRRLEQELVRAGCGDVETALALVERRLADGEGGADAAELTRQVLAEKPHLRAESLGRGGPTLPPGTAGAKPPGPAPAGRAVEQLAERARRTGQPSDVAAYMRARRGGGA